MIQLMTKDGLLPAEKAGRPGHINEEHEKFGASCGGSRWFNAEPKIEERRMVPVQQRWICPIDGCGGEMNFNGMVWPTGDPGNHHTCNKCGFTAAIWNGKYPQIVWRAA